MNSIARLLVTAEMRLGFRARRRGFSQMWIAVAAMLPLGLSGRTDTQNVSSFNPSGVR